MAIMPSVESPAAGQPFCVWAQASRNFAIHIPPEVIGSLGTESLVAFKRVPRRGLEIGGILLGRTEFRGDTTTFWVEGFAPIESEHRFGPSYLLSDPDLAHLQKELARNGTSSLGIYRSQTRSEKLGIQDADAGLFERCFGVSDNLFLMLAPLSRLGAFYFPEAGNLKCVHQFTLVSSLSSRATQGRTSVPHVNLQPELPAETHSVHANIARHSADQAGALIVASQRSDLTAPPGAVTIIDRSAGNMPSNNAVVLGSPGTYGRSMTAIRQGAAKLWSDCSGRSSGVKLRSWALAAVTLAVLTVNLLSYSFRRSTAPEHRAPNYLYLTVEQTGPALRLLWDGNSSAVRGATRAVLHIQDGDQQSDRELSPSEFLAGQFTYQPRHSAVTFRLNVYAGEPNAIGLVQVMFLPSPIPAAPAIEANPQSAQNNQPTAQPQVKPVARAEAPAPKSAPTVQINDDKDQNIEGQLPWSDTSEISPLAAISQVATREPFLPTRVEQPRQHPPVAEANDISTSGRELSVQVSTAPVPSSRFGRLFGKIPLVGHTRKQAKAVVAVPVYQAQPTVRMPNDRQLIRPVAVGVKVSVGESGAVNDAEVVDYGDPLNLTLANAALAAARNWTFAPSRVDDIPVASQVIIRFYFSP
jgi:hypothetical protein